MAFTETQGQKRVCLKDTWALTNYPYYKKMPKYLYILT